MKLVKIGDIHSMLKATHFKSTQAFFAYLLTSDLNNNQTTLLFLGDIVHYANSEPSVVALWIKFCNDFLGEIVILGGNHDDSALNKQNFLDIFEGCPNVTAVQEPCEMMFGSLKTLMLPFYRHTRLKHLPPMEDLYPSKTGEYDYIYLHMETKPTFSKGITLHEDLKGTIRSGHIHTGSENGCYLPSVNPTSTTEKDVKTYIEIVDCETKDVEKRYIPRFLNYVTFNYLDDIVIPNDGLYYLIDIYHAPGRKDAEEYYKDVLDQENVFLHKVYKKEFILDRQANLFTSTKVQLKTHKEFLLELASTKKFNNDLTSYLESLIA